YYVHRCHPKHRRHTTLSCTSLSHQESCHLRFFLPFGSRRHGELCMRKGKTVIPFDFHTWFLLLYQIRPVTWGLCQSGVSLHFRLQQAQPPYMASSVSTSH